MPVNYEEAKRIYAGARESKQAMGYISDEPCPIQGPSECPVSRLRPLRPQLVTMERVVRLIPDPNWWLQELFAGQHLLIRKTSARH